MSNVIKVVPGERLFGIRFWAQWYSAAIPRFEVFIYQGMDPDAGIYWFKSRSQGSRIGKGFRQLNVNGFVPFCINMSAIRTHLEGTNAPIYL